MTTRYRGHLRSESEAASFLETSVRTLQRMRAAGGGPRYVRAGKRRVLYCESDLAAWLEARTFTSIHDENARGA